RRKQIEHGAHDDLALVRLTYIGSRSGRQNHRIEQWLDWFTDHGLQCIAGYRQLESRQFRKHRAMSRRSDAGAFRADAAAIRIHADDAAVLFYEVDDFAILNDIDAQVGGGPCLAPGNRVMPSRTGAPLREAAEHGQSSPRREIECRS